MKVLLLMFALPLLATAGVPEERTIPIEHVYIPSGFDDNDNVEIVITGFLPNLCHKSPSASVSITEGQVDIKMTSLYYHESNPFCPEMVVPFTETVQLGLMSAGEYNVSINENSEFASSSLLKVARASSSAVDEHHYAYVDYVDKEPGSNLVKLKGYHVSDCFVLDSIDYYTNGKDTYSVLPKLKQVKEICPLKMTPFEYEFEVPQELNIPKVLLHVRTLNGKSHNTIFVNPTK